MLRAVAGDAVSLTVRNALPAGHTVSLEIPGVVFAPHAIEAPPGGSVTRTFTAVAGTYFYGSAGDSGRQQAMGLYGMLIVDPGAPPPSQAYGAAFDVEAPMVLSVLDPAFNIGGASGNLGDYRATWWLINGRSYPDTARITATAGQRVLLRYANAGFDNTAMSLVRGHQRVLARDAFPLPTPLDTVADVIPAGATEDTLFTVPTGNPPSGNGFPIYNRQLHLTNGSQTGPAPTPATGGMLTFIGP